MEHFFDDMTRDEVCRAYADQATDYQSCDKNYDWCDAYAYAKDMPDTQLLNWCLLTF